MIATRRDFFSSGSLRLFILPLALSASIIGIYWKTLTYPFIYDDWGILHSVIYHDPVDYLGSAFSPLGKIFYRPIGSLYFEIVYLLFNLNPVGFHVVSLLLHFCNSLLAVLIVHHISR